MDGKPLHREGQGDDWYEFVRIVESPRETGDQAMDDYENLHACELVARTHSRPPTEQDKIVWSRAGSFEAWRIELPWLPKIFRWFSDWWWVDNNNWQRHPTLPTPLHLESYIQVRHEGHKPILIPLDRNIKLCANSGTPCEPTQYWQIIGSSRIYLTITRLDLRYLVGLLSQFMLTPCDTQLHCAKTVLRYVSWTMDWRIFYNKLEATTLSLSLSQTHTHTYISHRLPLLNHNGD